MQGPQESWARHPVSSGSVWVSEVAVDAPVGVVSGLGAVGADRAFPIEDFATTIIDLIKGKQTIFYQFSFGKIFL